MFTDRTANNWNQLQFPVEFLNVDDEAQKHRSLTPLHLAAGNGQLDLVNTLIANGEDLNTKTDKRNTPLHLAAENGYPGIVNVLIEKRLDDNGENSDQVRPSL